MDGFELKEVMEQVHISDKMQEEIIMNIQNRMEKRTHKSGNWKKAAIGAAAFIIIAGAVSVPVQAFVSNIVKARMESIPIEEVQGISDMLRELDTEADGFSREYSNEEKERNKELWQAYKDGKFPENDIVQVDNAEDAPEGTLCYINSTGVFNLPAHEMTDEELLEIIDFQHKMSYAVSQSTAAQEAKAEMEAERNQQREIIEAAGGISEEEAIGIATKQMEAELGEMAEGKEILKYQDGSAAVIILDISEKTDYEHKGDFAYMVHFHNPNDHTSYECIIDAIDGSILEINK
ncbi:MAG: PepSY domain-containing protein [Lachnospiraceae bacterium]|nr:PepSY domain-containing protein [Lachnospiraceae bacterium]